MSELFLDTALDDADHRRIADIVRASPYDIETVERILRDEVLPAFGSNLLQVAGEWAGWREDEVRAIVIDALMRRSGIGKRIKTALLWRDIEREWRKIADIAPSAG